MNKYDQYVSVENIARFMAGITNLDCKWEEEFLSGVVDCILNDLESSQIEIKIVDDVPHMSRLDAFTRYRFVEFDFMPTGNIQSCIEFLMIWSNNRLEHLDRQSEYKEITE